jgi:hypothetical protein
MHLLGRQLLGHLCFIHRGGRDEIRGDPVRRQLECDVPDKLVQRRLRDAQRDHPVTGPTG